MPNTSRPRRSVLYMPGANVRALEKGRTLACDAIIMDLEDSVAPDAKKQARKNVAEAIKAGGYGKREVVVRVNALDTTWGYKDIVIAATSGADAILLPKTESANAVRQLERIMVEAGAPETMEIWCMIETPRGVLRTELIASASVRVSCLVMGTSDLAKDLHAHHTRERIPMVMSLGHCLLVARAYGLSILDGVHLDLGDDEGFEQSCLQGVDFGFDGKTLIHPKTIAKANEIFGPSEGEVKWSQDIITAFNAARSKGEGVVVIDGKLVENLHIVEAQRVVKMAERIKELEAGMVG
ncbi:MAG: CoA ester lyase [Rhodospirillaceae bacterium]|nr:CoA ester lyase [Rhodospirillaceae bacterium]